VFDGQALLFRNFCSAQYPSPCFVAVPLCPRCKPEASRASCLRPPVTYLPIYQSPKNLPQGHGVASIRIMQEAEIWVEMTCMQRSRNLPTTTPFFSKGLHIYTLMTGSTISFCCNTVERDSVGGMSIEALSVSPATTRVPGRYSSILLLL
jgi:hypothetical protein